MNIDTIKKFGLLYATKKVIHNIFLRLDLIFVRDAIHTHFQGRRTGMSSGTVS